MVDCVGVDQARTASAACLQIATEKLRQTPVFWGRYFKAPGDTSPIQYQANLETQFFNNHNIKVLPVGRQTANVDTPDRRLGHQDGLNNAAAMIASFGAAHLAMMTEVAVFLDVEIDTPLNHVYYDGWSEGLIAGGRDSNVRFAPCIYGHHNDGTTWQELGKAISNGAVCGAAWIVFMESMNFPIGPWKSKFTGRNMPPDVRVAIAQRVLDFKDAQGRAYDFDLVNPAHQDWLLQRLILPKAAPVVGEIPMAFDATMQRVFNRGVPPTDFLAELVAWGRTAPDEIFEPNNVTDIYSNVVGVLGPWQGLQHRRAAMLEVMRVLAGFESSWNWNAGRDVGNPTSVTPDTIEAGAFQVSANSMNFGQELKDLVRRKVGSLDGNEFQAAMKHDHQLAMEYVARLLRRTVNHHGPVKRHEIDEWLRRDAVAEFRTLLDAIS